MLIFVQVSTKRYVDVSKLQSRTLPFLAFVLYSFSMSLSTLSSAEMSSLKPPAQGPAERHARCAESLNPSADGDSECSWDPVSQGAMSDAAKRQRSPKPGLAVSLTASSAQWQRMEMTAHGKLPSQVPSCRQWAQTIITFGKMKSKQLSYLELVSSNDIVHTGYVKWIREHVNEASSAQLKDFAHFIETFNAVIPLHGLSEAHFPGSSVVRQYKK